MINNDVFKFMKDLPLHSELCRSLLDFFYADKNVSAAFISGSGAAGGMDIYSDLDLGFLCANDELKELLWSERFKWKLPPWFHRMDADHVKSHFIIYLFEPHIHVDLAFYSPESLPSSAGGPYVGAFDKNLSLGHWLTSANIPMSHPPDWSNVVHEEEQFWTWTHYSWCHTGRGEFYDDAASFGIMREILQRWHARLNGTEVFSTRKLEQRGGLAFVQEMRPCFPTPDGASLKAALRHMIKIHNDQRTQLDKIFPQKWKTTQTARDKITHLIENLN